MNTILRLPGSGTSKNIYLTYDLKQVKDSILLIMYVEKLKSWKKIFVTYEDGAWNTDMLAFYTDDKTRRQISNKLKLIYSGHYKVDGQNTECCDQTTQAHAAFLLGMCS